MNPFFLFVFIRHCLTTTFRLPLIVFHLFIISFDNNTTTTTTKILTNLNFIFGALMVFYIRVHGPQINKAKRKKKKTIEKITHQQKLFNYQTINFFFCYNVFVFVINIKNLIFLDEKWWKINEELVFLFLWFGLLLYRFVVRWFDCYFTLHYHIMYLDFFSLNWKSWLHRRRKRSER